MNTNTGLPPAVVLGLSPTGLYAIRELGRAGVPVTGLATGQQAGNASRYLTDVIVEPDGTKRLAALMKRFEGHDRKPVLIPTSDQDVDFIIDHADVLSERFVFQDSYRDGRAQKLLTKADFYTLCRDHGVAYPALWEVERNAIAGLRDEIRYPCMIKPSRIHEIKDEMAGRKGWTVRDTAEFDRTIGTIPARAGTLLVQEIVPGPESAITLFTAYFDRDGRAHQPFTCRKLRQYPPGFGSASLVLSQPEPDSRAIAEEFIRAIGYHGIAAAEFKRDPATGQLKIIEINTRPSLWFSVSTAAEKFVTLAAYHDLAETGVTLPEKPQVDGVLWRYWVKDVYSAIFYKLKRDFLLPPPDISSGQRPVRTTYAVSVPDDRAPGWAELANFGRKAFRRVLPGRGT